MFELADTPAKSSHAPENAWREVHNYSRALSNGMVRLKELPFCGRLIRELHAILLSDVLGNPARPGEWRDHPVAIGSNRRFVPPPVPQMLQALEDLEEYINDEEPAGFDPLVRAFIVHYQFEAIHPFADGNGRIGRVLLSLMVGEWCKLSVPWLYLSPFFEQFKEEYIAKLFNVSAVGDWASWIEFCLRGTIRQSEDAISKCEALQSLKAGFLARIKSTGSTRTDRIIDDLFRNPIVRIPELRRRYSVSSPTAQADVDRLVAAQILKQLSGTYPKAYYAPEVFQIAYPP